MLSSYRLMWMMVMFDLPVVEKQERREASEFRNHLQDLGFEMAQFSVYMRFCTGPGHAKSLVKKIQESLPAGGRTGVLFFTDKQYERMLSFRGGSKEKAKRNPAQFVLF
ncbi:MAG: CRISPR-associated endonuclease Cas2 [Betaproteobacteria bacterium]